MQIFSFLLCAALSLSAALHAQNYDDYKAGKGEEFVVKKDSTKIYGNVKLTKGKISLDGTLYDYNDLLGYKEGKHYHAIFGNDFYWVFALGKIQAYMKWITTGANTNIAVGYIRKGNGDLLAYTTRNLYNLIGGNATAVAEFDKYFTVINDKTPIDLAFRKLQKVLAIYNGNEVQNF